MTLSHALDWQGHYRLILDYHAGKRQLSGHIAGPPGSTGMVEQHLLAIISLEAGGQICSTVETGIHTSPRFTLMLPEACPPSFPLAVRLGGTIERPGELFGEYDV